MRRFELVLYWPAQESLGQSFRQRCGLPTVQKESTLELLLSNNEGAREHVFAFRNNRENSKVRGMLERRPPVLEMPVHHLSFKKT